MSPFTWALSRIFGAFIMIVGACLSIYFSGRAELPKQQTISRLMAIGLLFLLFAYVVVDVASTSLTLPKTIFEGHLVTRPFDIMPLGLFIFASALFGIWYLREKTPLRFALLLSCIPACMTQLHMAFGSAELFDNDFNIAHGLKVLSYALVLFGLVVDMVRLPIPSSLPSSEQDPAPNESVVEDVANTPEKLSSKLMELGRVKQPLTLLLPVGAFLLSIAISAVLTIAFYFENVKTINQIALDSLAEESLLIEPKIGALYDNAFSDLSFLSGMPPIPAMMESKRSNDLNQERIWRRRLETIFSEFMSLKPLYSQIRYIGKGDSGQELVNVVRRPGGLVAVPESRLAKKGHRDYVVESLATAVGNVYFSRIELNREQGEIVVPHEPVMRAATPVFDPVNGEVFGIVIINVRIDWFIESLLDSLPNNLVMHLANQQGDYIYHPEIERRFSTELNRSFSIFSDYPDLGGVKLVDAHAAFEQLASPGGERFLGQYSRVIPHETGAKDPLFLLLLKNQKIVAENLVDSRNYIVLIGIGLSFAALALSLLVVRRISEPISQMTQSIEQYEQTSQLTQLPTHSQSEVGLFARSFHNLLIRIEAASYEQQEVTNQLSTVLYSVADPIITLNPAGEILSFNQSASKVFQYSKGEVLGQPFSVLFPEEFQEQVMEQVHNFHENHAFTRFYEEHDIATSFSGEMAGLRKGERRFPLTLSLTEVQTSDGSIFSVVIRDISAQRAYEAQLIEARQSAEESNRLKSEFLAAMSHEIRTPMNGVLGMLELLKKDNLNETQLNKVTVGYNSARSLLTLINDILDFSKIEADHIDFFNEPFDLMTLLGDVMSSFAPAAEEKNLELILDFHGVEQSMVCGDVNRLRQILMNLVGNAVKFTDQGEVLLRVALMRESAHGSEPMGGKERMAGALDGVADGSGAHDNDGWVLRCEVIDSGVGIAKETLPHIFDSFTQADGSTTKRHEGTGLGLAIAHKLCHLMGGGIAVESTLGQGSTFEFHVRLASTEQTKSVTLSDECQGLRVLLVDDHPLSREAISQQLTSWGIDCTQAGDATQALNALSNCTEATLFDIILLDIDMPNVNGIELGVMIRENPLYARVRLIAMMSLADVERVSLLQSVGFDSYFSKPVVYADYELLTVGSRFSEVSSSEQPSHRADGSGGELDESLALSPADSMQSAEVTQLPGIVRLLVVEDNLVNREVLLGILEEIDLNADCAENGLEALSMLKQRSGRPYEVILMDCQMPEMDGYDATKAIRAGMAGEQYREIPIIALTANAMAGDKERCLAAGMSDYLSKPVDFLLLEQALMKWLGSSDGLSHNVKTAT